MHCRHELKFEAVQGPDPFQCKAILGEIELQNLHFRVRVRVEGNQGENHGVKFWAGQRQHLKKTALKEDQSI